MACGFEPVLQVEVQVRFRPHRIEPHLTFEEGPVARHQASEEAETGLRDIPVLSMKDGLTLSQLPGPERVGPVREDVIPIHDLEQPDPTRAKDSPDLIDEASELVLGEVWRTVPDAEDQVEG